MQTSRGIDLDVTDSAPDREFDSEVVEISLLLPSWQALELERKAFQQGLTTGQMVRRLLGSFFESS
jgi:hypothetical protein